MFVNETDFEFIVHESQSVSRSCVIGIDIVVDGKVVDPNSNLMRLFKHTFHVVQCRLEHCNYYL